MMTSTQRRLFLGALCDGLSTDSALEEAGLLTSDLLKQMDSDPAFRIAYQFAEAARDRYVEFMEALQE